MNKLIILTGKTASGKDTVAAKLLKTFPDFRKVLTTTSRSKRAGEKNGEDYNFIPKNEFLQKIEKDDFIEYVEYAGNFYGTEKSQLISDCNLIWRIDPSRAGQVRDLIKDKNILVIYLTVNDEIVLQRLKARNLSQEEIDKRMKEDADFWDKYKDNYDFVVKNVPGKLDETMEKIISLIKE